VGLFAGALSALTRISAPFTVIPILVVALGVNIRSAVAASLVAVVATASNNAVMYLRSGCSNMNMAICAAVASGLGALAGAAVGAQLTTPGMALAFGVTLLYFAHRLTCSHDLPVELDSSTTATASKRAPPEAVPGRVDLAGLGFMFMAGSLSGLIGIGPAAVQVFEMERSIQRPDSVSGATAHFLIGITAAVSGSVYLQHGFMDAELAIPLMCGVYCGSFLGAGAQSYSLHRKDAGGRPVRPGVDGPFAIAPGLPPSTKSTS
jgi:uncharacterized protein